MRLKRREEDKFFDCIKRFFRRVFRKLRSKKVRILLWCLIGASLFFIGIFIGMLSTGFFGTFDNPSQNALNIAHSWGINNLRKIKIGIEAIIAENIRIPLNYLKGQFSNPEKIYIDINFEDYKRIEYKREEALKKGLLISSSEDYVPTKISYKDETVNVNLRLKGDELDHLRGSKWSFRIKVKGDETLFGMKTFSIQDPKTRNYLSEFIYHKALRREGVMSIRYDFIEVVVNGKNKGIYAIEEHFDKELIGDNERREGVIIRFEDSFFMQEMIPKMEGIIDVEEKLQILRDSFYVSNIETFYNKERTLEDPESARQFLRAKELLESFRRGELKTHEVFDVEKLSKFFAISTLITTDHIAVYGNLRFYYNPITDLLEPIGFDAGPNIEEVGNVIKEFIPAYLGQGNYSGGNKKITNLFFEDEIFYKSYMQEVERISREDYLDDLFSDLEGDIEKKMNILHKDDPIRHFAKETYYKNQEMLRKELNPFKSVNAFLQRDLSSENKIVLIVGNAGSFPIEVTGVTYNNSVDFGLMDEKKILGRKTAGAINYEQFEFASQDFACDYNCSFNLQINYKIYGLEKEMSDEIFPWPYEGGDFSEEGFLKQKPVEVSSEFIEVDEELKIISIKKGEWTLNQSLIIPNGFNFMVNGGTTINLINGAAIISYSKLKFTGTESAPIRIISSDKSGQGLTVLNAKEESYLEHVYFQDLRNPSKDKWEITGAITFYESPFKFNHVNIKGMKAEDSLDGINSKYEIKNSVFEDCFSDCIDDDFGGGYIESTSFLNCGDDCLDISGAEIVLRDIDIINAGDKGISVGERSSLTGKRIEIKGAYIGVASKDLSYVKISDIKVSDSDYGFVVYQKKAEFGGAEIIAIGAELSSNKENYLVEKGSGLSVNKEIILNNKEGLFNQLYPV